MAVWAFQVVSCSSRWRVCSLKLYGEHQPKLGNIEDLFAVVAFEFPESLPILEGYDSEWNYETNKNQDCQRNLIHDNELEC